jgi:hypothetical protein
VSNVLEKMQGRKDINNSLVKPAAGERGGEVKDENNRDSWTLRQWEQKDPVNLKKMVTEDKDKYNKLFKAEYGVEPGA